MAKLADLLEKQVKINEEITTERKKGAGNRDKVKVRKLQTLYKEITAIISKHHEDDRHTPLDKEDKSEKEFKDKREKERLAKLKKKEEKQSKFTDQ